MIVVVVSSTILTALALCCVAVSVMVLSRRKEASYHNAAKIDAIEIAEARTVLVHPSGSLLMPDNDGNAIHTFH